jgi:hypothetical protein
MMISCRKTSILFLAILFVTLMCQYVLGGTMEATAVKGITPVGHLDIEGGGMVDVQGKLAAIGHMEPPFATSIIDVSDPGHPRVVSRIKTRPGTHSHKARLCGNILVINAESYKGWKQGDKAGLAFFDISNPAQPREIAFMEMGGLDTGGTGVHRFSLDRDKKLIYASASATGYQGNITMIVDFSDATKPREIGRWWAPGQWIAGGEKPTWQGTEVRTHHPNRWDNRLYVPLWGGGFSIVDITDMKKPRTISHFDYHPAYSWPTHTALPVGHKILGRDWLIVFDEAMGGTASPPAFMWVFDITDETNPVPVATFQVPEQERKFLGEGRFGAHQPHEYVGPDNLVYAAWFSGGLRVIDISNPYRPGEVAHYVPKPPTGFRSAQTNDLFVAADGLIYLIDRNNGLDILKLAPMVKGAQ